MELTPAAASRDKGELVSTRILLIALAITGTVAFVTVAFPTYVIRPFRSQGATELAVSLVVRQWSVEVTTVCAAVCLLLTAVLWSRIHAPRIRIKRAGIAAIAVLALATALLSRVNMFERMFHPITSAQFVPAANARIDNKEMVLAVRIGSDKRAYPVAIMAYHHVFNDVLGGEPLVVTY